MFGLPRRDKSFIRHVVKWTKAPEKGRRGKARCARWLATTTVVMMVVMVVVVVVAAAAAAVAVVLLLLRSCCSCFVSVSVSVYMSIVSHVMWMRRRSNHSMRGASSHCRYCRSAAPPLL